MDTNICRFIIKLLKMFLDHGENRVNK